MKRLICITLVMLACAGTVYAAQNLQNAVGTPVQGFAPDGTLSQTLTNSNIIDLSTSIAFGVYCASDAVGRILPSNAKGSYPTFTIPGGSWLVRVRNQATPFLNISGNCQLQRQ